MKKIYIIASLFIVLANFSRIKTEAIEQREKRTDELLSITNDFLDTKSKIEETKETLRDTKTKLTLAPKISEWRQPLFKLQDEIYDFNDKKSALSKKLKNLELNEIVNFHMKKKLYANTVAMLGLSSDKDMTNKFLLHENIDIHEKDEKGKDLLYYACNLSCYNVAKEFLKFAMEKMDREEIVEFLAIDKEGKFFIEIRYIDGEKILYYYIYRYDDSYLIRPIGLVFVEFLEKKGIEVYPESLFFVGNGVKKGMFLATDVQGTRVEFHAEKKWLTFRKKKNLLILAIGILIGVYLFFLLRESVKRWRKIWRKRWRKSWGKRKRKGMSIKRVNSISSNEFKS